MKSNALKGLITCALFVLATASTATAQKVTDQHIADLIREAALRAGVDANVAGAPPSAQAAAGQGNRPTVRLSLDEAIKLALDRNLDIAVQRLNPQTFDFSLAGLRASYRPALTSTLSQQSQTNPSNNTTQGAAAGTGINTSTATYNGGLSQSVPWGGGSFVGVINNNKQTTTSLTSSSIPNTTPTGLPPILSQCCATSRSTTRGSSWSSRS